MIRHILLIGFAVLTATDATASESRVPVFTSHQCTNDNVGDRLVFRTREAIRGSSSLSLSEEYGKSFVQLSIVCLDPSSADRGVVSNYSYSITAYNSKGRYDFSLTHAVGVCGSDRVPSCAESILAAIDRAVSDLRATIRAGKLYFGGGQLCVQAGRGERLSCSLTSYRPAAA